MEILPILWCKAHRGNIKSDLSVGERYSATTTAHSEYFGAQIHDVSKYRNIFEACQGVLEKFFHIFKKTHKIQITTHIFS
jgi:hypothetical protein